MNIGIIGAGQLGRMLALAGYPMGLRFLFLDRSEDTPGGQLGEVIVGDYGDARCLDALARRSDVLTFEFENVPAPALESLPAHPPLWPPKACLEIAQDRLEEKRLFGELAVETAQFHPVDSYTDLERGAAALGLPAVLKTRHLGYDGKGQSVLRTPQDLQPAWEKSGGVPLLLEQFVDFEFEVSIIGARSSQAETAFYPLARNHHEGGILRNSIAPFIDRELQATAETVLDRAMNRLGYVGVLTIEFFVKDGRLLANEMAPRVHNSGHWTIEGASTSQFENHLRAILGMPLGSTAATGHSALVNFLGEMPARQRVLALAGAHYHDYCKSPRAGRKLGHGTIVAATPAERDARLAELLDIVRD